MSLWYLLGGLGLAAGLVWLVVREPAKVVVDSGKTADGKTNKDLSGSTNAETKKALEALASLPANLLLEAEDAILSGDVALMSKVAQKLDDAGRGIEAQVLRGRALATRAASAGGMPPLNNCLMFTPPRSPAEAIARDIRQVWTDRFAATSYATQDLPADPRLFEASSLHDQAGVLLDGLYVIDGVTYFVGDPRTMAGSMMVDYTAAVPEAWSTEGAIPGLYLPTTDELRVLQSAVATGDAKAELEAVLAGMGESSPQEEVWDDLMLPEYLPTEYLPLYDNSAFFNVGAIA